MVSGAMPPSTATCERYVSVAAYVIIFGSRECGRSRLLAPNPVSIIENIAVTASGRVVYEDTSKKERYLVQNARAL